MRKETDALRPSENVTKIVNLTPRSPAKRLKTRRLSIIIRENLPIVKSRTALRAPRRAHDAAEDAYAEGVHVIYMVGGSMVDTFLGKIFKRGGRDGGCGAESLCASVDASNALEVVGLGKRYRDGDAFVVRGLSFVCREGEIVALIGANGVGKSTTLKCIAGILNCDEGVVSVFGRYVKGDAVAAKRLIGYVPDDHAVIPYMSGRQYLRFCADVRGVAPNVREERIASLAARLALDGVLDEAVQRFSHGTKQKLCMAGSLVGAPRLWILDEPVTGLDVASSDEVRVLMKEFAAGGGCVLFSSHDLDGVAKTCTRVIEIKDGSATEVPVATVCRRQEI